MTTVVEAMDNEITRLIDLNIKLVGSLAEMVEIYWGGKDDVRPLPAHIARANTAIAEHKCWQ